MFTPTLQNALDIHKGLVAYYDCSPIILNKGLLESAVYSAYQTFGGIDLFPTALEKICRISFGIIKNHPFEDGNKRVGIGVLILGLLRNNFKIPLNDKLIEIALNIAAGKTQYRDLLHEIESIQSN